MHLIDVVRIERALIRNGQANPCLATCDCHNNITCLRAQHPHEPGNVAPHVGRDTDDQPVQWECLPPPSLDDAQPPAPAGPVDAVETAPWWA